MKQKKPINVEVGQRIKKQREMAGFTQEQLAEMLNLGVKHISAIECGAAGITLATLQKICRALSVSSDAIVMGDTGSNDARALTDRLERLPPRQYQIAEEMLCKLLEAFAIGNTEE